MRYVYGGGSVMKLLFLLLFCFSFSSAHAGDGDVVPITSIVLIGLVSIPTVILGSLIKIGFVKHFTRVRRKDAVIIAIGMNIISFIFGLPILYNALCIALLPKLYNALGIALNSTISYIFGGLFVCIPMVFVNTLIEGGIIQMKLDRPFSKTYRWLSVANAISVGICAICLYFITCAIKQCYS
jgi:hypothetical protein